MRTITRFTLTARALKEDRTTKPLLVCYLTETEGDKCVLETSRCADVPMPEGIHTMITGVLDQMRKAADAWREETERMEDTDGRQ